MYEEQVFYFFKCLGDLSELSYLFVRARACDVGSVHYNSTVHACDVCSVHYNSTVHACDVGSVHYNSTVHACDVGSVHYPMSTNFHQQTSGMKARLNLRDIL